VRLRCPQSFGLGAVSAATRNTPRIDFETNDCILKMTDEVLEARNGVAAVKSTVLELEITGIQEAGTGNIRHTREKPPPPEQATGNGS
jgi:hypothetical protein